MRFIDYLMFNFCVAGGVSSFIACVFMGIWMADCLVEQRYKQATIAGLLFVLTVSSACVVGAYGCMLGDRMFKNKDNAGSFAKGELQ